MRFSEKGWITLFRRAQRFHRPVDTKIQSFRQGFRSTARRLIGHNFNHTQLPPRRLSTFLPTHPSSSHYRHHTSPKFCPAVFCHRNHRRSFFHFFEKKQQIFNISSTPLQRSTIMAPGKWGTSYPTFSDTNPAKRIQCAKAARAIFVPLN